MSEHLAPEYAVVNERETDKYSTPKTHTVTNRQGETVLLRSGLLAEHFAWAMTRPLPKEDNDE